MINLRTYLKRMIIVGVTFGSCVQAGITGSVEVHNSRNSDVTLSIWRANGTNTDYIVRAASYRSILVGDNKEGTTWLIASDSSGELKREAASGEYSSYTWWID